MTRRTVDPGLRLVGPYALVTGASGGVGRAVTRALQAAGATTVHGWDRAAGWDADVRGRVVDLADPDDVVDALAELPRPPQIVVHAAGAYQQRSGFEFEARHLRRTFELNVVSAFLVHREVSRRLRTEGSPGAFVNIASVAGKRGFPDQADYVVAKAALIGLTRAGALDLSPLITVNAVAPGAVDTAMIDDVLADVAHTTGLSVSEQRRAFEDAIPTGRLQRPDEIAATVVFLASTAARSINGEVLTIDGGVTRD